MQTIGIVGAGTMGRGIAQAIVQKMPNSADEWTRDRQKHSREPDRDNAPELSEGQRPDFDSIILYVRR
jgi:3-hydroxyacyl-CoA dehydrogenase